MSTIPQHITTRTIYGNLLLTAAAWKIKYDPLEGSTLNEKFGVHANTNWPDSEVPALLGTCIGIGGHINTPIVDDISLPSSVPHRVRDGAMFKMMPFVLRPLNNDLSAIQRANYAIRAKIEISGVYYWAYYVRLVNTATLTPEVKHTIITNGISNTENFQTDTTVLSPTRPQLPLPVLSETEGEYFSVFLQINLGMTQAEVAEYRNVAQIMYGDPNVAIISEYGVVGGIRRTVPLLDANGQETSTNYNEILGCVVTSFTTIYQNVGSANEGYTLKMNSGANEPLYGPLQTTVTP